MNNTMLNLMFMNNICYNCIKSLNVCKTAAQIGHLCCLKYAHE